MKGPKRGWDLNMKKQQEGVEEEGQNGQSMKWRRRRGRGIIAKAKREGRGDFLCGFFIGGGF